MDLNAGRLGSILGSRSAARGCIAGCLRGGRNCKRSTNERTRCALSRARSTSRPLRTGVLLITGATASGKTDLAIESARKFDAEIVGADSRQIYRGMPVGTAAPTAAQLASVPHHLIGFLDPAQRYSAARFSSEAVACINAIHARGKRAIVAGGTGFYIRALTGGVDLAPQFDERLRERLAREARLHDSGFMYEWLTLRDPEPRRNAPSGRCISRPACARNRARPARSLRCAKCATPRW